MQRAWSARTMPGCLASPAVCWQMPKPAFSGTGDGANAAERPQRSREEETWSDLLGRCMHGMFPCAREGVSLTCVSELQK